MLEAIVGSRSVQNVLLFLFINGKCYGTQVQRQLRMALTPIQKALDRLEKGGIVMSYYEGKTRLYHFNPSYPLLSELEQLISRAYAHLPAQEKRMFCYVKPQEGVAHEGTKVLASFWKRLALVQNLTFVAKSKSKDESGWNGQGKGAVTISKEGDKILIFQEKGSWKDKSGNEIAFSNTFRWTLDIHAQVISLEHLRHGFDAPVFLFHLAPSGGQSLSSLDSHLCGEDAYFGQVIIDRHSLRLSWRVIGPKKNEEIQTYYT